MYSLLFIGPLIFQWCGRCIQKEISISCFKSAEKSGSDDPYDICLKLNLMSLEKRRSLTDVTLLYKEVNGNIDIDISKITI